MCGISGVLQVGNKCDTNFVETELIINTLIDSIKLRGPNKSGKQKFKKGFLGHTRLSIRDLTKASNQPVILRNNQGFFVYNGEIYNESELSKYYSLTSKNSDTLYLKSLFEKITDISFIDKLVGDFAIAYWNNEAKKLFLIRDQIGKKPLYYTSYKNYFLFNSSIRGIQDVINSKSINNDSLSNYLVYGNMFDEKTIFKEIYQLMPGNILIFDSQSGEITIKKYFDFQQHIIQSKYINKNYEDLKNLLSENIELVIKSHLCSDVPLSILLSSGIDSKVIARYSLSSKVKAYTANFETNWREIEDSKKFANHFEGLEHKIINIKESKVFEVLEKIIEFIGEPFADASIIPLFYLYSNLPKNRKVVLQGDGGDELFGGYRRYQIFEMLMKFPKNNLLKNIPQINKINHRLNRLIFLSSFKDEELYKNIMTSDFVHFNTLSFFRNYFAKKQIDPLKNYGNSYIRDFRKTIRLETSEQLSCIDYINQLPNQFLYKVDRVSMMCGIEARTPLIDIRLLKLIFSIDPKIRFKHNPRKKFFRDSVDIPKNLKYTPKRGFGTPITKWMQLSKQYLKEYILSESFIQYFNLEKKELEKLINMNKYSATESYCLWKILCLSIWFKKVFKSEY